MRILVITHEYPPVGGGGANACRFLCRCLSAGGHEGVILTSAYQRLPKEERAGNFRIIRVPALRAKKEKSTFPEMFTYLCSAMLRADKLVRKETFDICQVFFGIPSGPIALFLKKKYRLPYVVRFGGGDIPGAQKRFSTLYKLLAPLIRAIWGHADALIANSDGLKQRALRFENRYPVQVICNGVDTAFFRPATAQAGQSQRDTGAWEILFVSRLIEGKGMQFVIPHLRKIAEGLGRAVHLTIVGDGPYRRELERIACEAGVESMVSFAGNRGKAELPAWYQKADVFILPSLSEGMPNVALEAMACGLPVIMTPCEGSRELIGDNGIIAEQAQFIAEMIRLGNNPDLGREMGRLGREKAVQVFRWEKTAEAYEGVYGRIVSGT